VSLICISFQLNDKRVVAIEELGHVTRECPSVLKQRSMTRVRVDDELGIGQMLTGVGVISCRDILRRSGGVACSHVEPLDPLTEDKLIEIDGDDQRLGRGMAVRLARQDPPLRRKDDARELLEIGDVVCRRCTRADLHVVVVPLALSSATR
jgi:hypothetical protein